MSEFFNSADKRMVGSICKMLLEDGEFIAFKYDSGFTLCFQFRDFGLRATLPAEVKLVLKGNWVVRGDKPSGEPIIALGQQTDSLNQQDAPSQAYMLMSLVGKLVKNVTSFETGELLINFGEWGHIRTATNPGEWDFCWYLFVPSSMPGHDLWSIECSSEGEMTGVWPTEVMLRPEFQRWLPSDLRAS